MATEDLLNASQFLEEPTSVETDVQPQPQASQDVLGGLRETFVDKEDVGVGHLLPETLNIAGIDTGVPLSKKAAATLVGMGDGMLDLAHGVQQIIGNEETKRDLQAEQNLLNDLYNDPRYGTAARVGQVGGFLADPIGVLVPVAHGKKLWDVAKIGAATGTVYGGLGYVDEESGQTRAGNALVGMVTGGVLSPTVFGATRAYKGAGGKMQERAADSLLNTYKKEFNRHIAGGKTPTQATHFSMKKMGWSNQDKAALIMASRKPFEMKQGDFNILAAQRNLDSMQNRIIRKGGEFLEQSSVGRGVKEAGKSLGRGFTEAVVPISTRIATKDADLGAQFVAMEARIKRAQQGFHEKVLGFNKTVRSLDNETATTLKLHLANQEMGQARSLFLKSGGSSRDWDRVSGVLRSMFNEANRVGYALPKVSKFFPRRVKDLEGLGKHQHSNLSEEIQAFIQVKKRNPSDKELDRMVESITNPKHYESFKTGGSLRKRIKKTVDEEEVGFYHDTEATLTSYINDMVSDIERARFLTKVGAKKPAHGYALDGTDLEDTMAGLLRKRQKEGRYHAGDVEELTGLLRSRFTSGELAPSAALQAFKNSTYIATLGNVKSAMTQLGDLAFAAHRNGVVNVSLELMNRIPGLKRIVKESHKRVTKEQIGLEDAIQDFAGDRNGKRALDWILGKTGFKAMDRLGKETFINSHMRLVRKRLNNPKLASKERMEMRRKWNPVFGTETDKMIDDLAAGRFSDNVSVYLFSNLSEVQPIALSEMPKAYLDNPNGRIFYMLRSFTIKQLDLMRRDILDNFARGNAPEAFKNLTSLGTLFVLANGSADMLKDFMTGKEIEMEDTLVDNVWKLMGVNRYTGDRILSGTPGQAITDMLAPPLTVWDRAIRAPGDSQKTWEASPFNGLQIFDEMFNSGELTRSDSDDYYSKLGTFHDSFDRED